MPLNQLTFLTLTPPLRARSAVAGDRSFLLQLEEDCMREHVIALWGEWRPRPTEMPLIEGCQIIVDSDLNVGCVSLYWNKDHIWVDRLYLKKSHQRRGIGATILHCIVREAHRHNVPVRLAVLVTNPALSFYQREGFHIYDRGSELFLLSS